MKLRNSLVIAGVIENIAKSKSGAGGHLEYLSSHWCNSEEIIPDSLVVGVVCHHMMRGLSQAVVDRDDEETKRICEILHEQFDELESGAHLH